MSVDGGFVRPQFTLTSRLNLLLLTLVQNPCLTLNENISLSWSSNQWYSYKETKNKKIKQCFLSDDKWFCVWHKKDMKKEWLMQKNTAWFCFMGVSWCIKIRWGDVKQHFLWKTKSPILLPQIFLQLIYFSSASEKLCNLSVSDSNEICWKSSASLAGGSNIDISWI